MGEIWRTPKNGGLWGRLTTAEAIREKDERGEVCVEVLCGEGNANEALVTSRLVKSLGRQHEARVAFCICPCGSTWRPPVAAAGPVPYADASMGAAGTRQRTPGGSRA
jgi:hypothetical protein